MDKKTLRLELVRAQKWVRFCALRDQYEKGGMSPNDAYARAASELLGREVVPKETGAAAPVLHGETDQAAFSGGSASTPACVSWVAKHMMVKGVNPTDAPSSEAWAMLCWAKRNNQNEAQFWGQIYTKLLPSRSQLDAEDRYRDDGRKVLDIIENLREDDE